MYLAFVKDAAIAANPADVSHGSIDTFYVELVFQAYWQTVQRSHGPAILLQIVVELLCSVQGSVKKYLEETRVLATKF